MDRQLKAAFDGGSLLAPSGQNPNLVDLVRAIATRCGVDEMPRTGGLTHILSLIPPADHIVFVLVDALGMNIVERLPRESFVRSRLRGELLSVFPSTTAAALTTIATAQWPNQHAVTGWWTYLAEHGVTATILPFIERFSMRPLSSLGLTPEKVFPVGSIHSKMKHEPLTLLPEKLPNTTYSIYSRGATAARGFRTLDPGLEVLADHVRNAHKPTYTYMYVPDLDTLGHYRGWDHPDVIALAQWIDVLLGRLARALENRARMIVAADHGQTKVPLEERQALYEGDSLLEMLKVPPSGNPPTPIFHVRDGRHEEFVAMFQERFGHRFSLLSIAEAEAMELLGPGTMSEIARKRFGDFIGIARRPATLKFYERGRVPAADDFGSHSGLTPAEMRIPLVVM